MKILLDTNVFIWASREPTLLSDTARKMVMASYHDRYVSMASLWEIQVKHGLGKLPLPARIEEVAGTWMQALAAELLPIELHHVGKLYDLPRIHKDPFDRLLVAQAISEGMQIVSSDKALQAYNVPIVW